jgi:hypothetical protein
MRARDNVVELQQRMIGRRRLRIPDIESRPGDTSRAQRLGECHRPMAPDCGISALGGEFRDDAASLQQCVKVRVFLPRHFAATLLLLTANQRGQGLLEPNR